MRISTIPSLLYYDKSFVVCNKMHAYYFRGTFLCMFDTLLQHTGHTGFNQKSCNFEKKKRNKNLINYRTILIRAQ